MIVGEPSEELGCFLAVVGSDRRRLGVEVLGDRNRSLAHRDLVLVGRPHVAEHPDQVEAEPVAHDRVGLPVDLDVVEGLPDDVAGSLLTVVEHREQLAVEAALDDEHRVDRDVQAEPWRVSSAVRESGRHGMSSVTTCTTVCGEAKPCSSKVGENTATFGSAGGR